MRGLSKAILALAFSTGLAMADEITLLAFGDSLTQGYGLPPEQGFTAQLENWIEAAGTEVRVINGGVSGDTTAGGAARINWSLSDEVDAVIVALGGNDMLRGLPPEEAMRNLGLILGEIQKQGLPALLVGMSAPQNFGPEYKAAFDAIYADLAMGYDVALFANFLQGLEDVGDRQKVLESYMQGDGLHPNGAGVALIVARIGPEVLKLIGLRE